MCIYVVLTCKYTHVHMYMFWCKYTYAHMYMFVDDVFCTIYVYVRHIYIYRLDWYVYMCTYTYILTIWLLPKYKYCWRKTKYNTKLSINLLNLYRCHWRVVLETTITSTFKTLVYPIRLEWDSCWRLVFGIFHREINISPGVRCKQLLVHYYQYEKTRE